MNARDRIGVDIGGTTLKGVRITYEGAVLRQETVAAGGQIPRDALLATVSAMVARLEEGEAAAHVGIAIGGLVRADGIMPGSASNLPNLADLPLAKVFAESLRRPVTVLNDAQAAMHGEAWVGAARGLSEAMLVTFGTGIGSGLLLGGRVRSGAHGTAGEIGAWGIASEAGGSFEAVAAPVAFARAHGQALADAVLDAGSVTGQSALSAIGRCLAAAHVLLDLEAILVGGGLAERGESWRAAIEVAVRRHCPPAMLHDLSIRLSALGPYAGAIGAVAPTVVRGCA